MLGTVYLGKDIKTWKEVALKVERRQGSHSDLLREYRIYKDITGCPGVSEVYWYGSEGLYNVMVIDRYIRSLDSMIREAPLELRTAVSFADQMVRQSRRIHGPLFTFLAPYRGIHSCSSLHTP